MARKSPYPAEMRARAVRMVGEVRPNYDSEYAAIKAVAARLSIGSAETLRKWVRRAEVDAGTRPGITTGENEQDGTEVEYVQVHPDTDSFENHMRVVERSGRSYTGVHISERCAISGCSGHAVRPRLGMLAGS